jgi:hypothetical protein
VDILTKAPIHSGLTNAYGFTHAPVRLCVLRWRKLFKKLNYIKSDASLVEAPMLPKAACRSPRIS